MRVWIVLAVAMTFVPAVTVASPTDYKLASAPTSLLGDHLRITLAVDMKIAPRGHNVMAADSPSEDETRGQLDNGEMRFVMMAYELYATPTADFRAAIGAWMRAQGDPLMSANLEPLTLPSPLVGFAAAPDCKAVDEANLMYIAFVASADHSAQMIAFYVNRFGVADLAGFRALAQEMVKSIAAGKRLLSVAARDHKFRGAGSDKLVISAPAGFASSTQDGPDFSVYHLRQVADLGTIAPSCGIYLGGYPSYQHEQAGIDSAKVENVPGRLLGTSATWRSWKNGSMLTIEAMAPYPKQDLIVHMFCSATKASELDELRMMAETLRVES